MRYDCIVIGSGPAGLSAVLNLKIHNKSILWFGNGNLSEKVEKAERVENYPGLPGVSGSQLQQAFLAHKDAMGLEITDTIETQFHCDCSKEKVSRALATINKKDLDDIINDGESIEIKCQFCSKAYNFDIEELKEIRKA